MANLHLETIDNRTAFSPGQAIEGVAGWELDEVPRSVEVRLLWYTTGKGDRDMAVADRVSFEQPEAAAAKPFTLTVPSGPYSFTGKLISLTWSLELVVNPGNDTERLELVISPDGQAVRLTSDDTALAGGADGGTST